MLEYNPEKLRTLATSLHRRALFLTPSYLLVGGIVGYLASSGVTDNASILTIQSAFQLRIAITVIVALIGGEIGSRKSLRQRIEAQQVLCQLQAEENTRR